MGFNSGFKGLILGNPKCVSDVSAGRIASSANIEGHLVRGENAEVVSTAPYKVQVEIHGDLHVT